MRLHEDFNPILVLAPHTDDGEIGCGGFIAKAIEMGFEVHYAAFSNAQISLPPGMPDDTLIKEVKAATQTLGIKPENLLIYDFPTRRFPEERQDILETMVRLRTDLSPRLILIPSLQDMHQDHMTVAQEALRCFKTETVLSYEEPWNNISFSTQCFVKLDEQHVQKKIDALRCYESQKHRDYINVDSVKSILKMRGVQIRCEYAEAFEVIRWML